MNWKKYKKVYYFLLLLIVGFSTMLDFRYHKMIAQKLAFINSEIVKVIHGTVRLSFVDYINDKIYYLAANRKLDCSIPLLFNGVNITLAKCSAKYEANKKFNNHLNIILSNEMRYANSFYPNISFAKLKADTIQISSFCWGKENLKCWAEFASNGSLKQEHYKHFSKYYPLINSYESVCIFGNSRLALNAQLMYSHIDTKKSINFVFVSPVINPFNLDEFAHVREKFTEATLKKNGYLEDLVLNFNDKIIASTSERDERVNEKNLLALYNKQPKKMYVFVNKGVNSHSNFLPKEMIRIVIQNCSGK